MEMPVALSEEDSQEGVNLGWEYKDREGKTPDFKEASGRPCPGLTG